MLEDAFGAGEGLVDRCSADEGVVGHRLSSACCESCLVELRRECHHAFGSSSSALVPPCGAVDDAQQSPCPRLAAQVSAPFEFLSGGPNFGVRYACIAERPGDAEGQLVFDQC